MDPDREDWWFPEYRVDKSTLITIEEVSSNECPVSEITPETKALLDMESRNRRAKEATGATLFGPDAGQWPAWWWDAVTLIEAQHQIIEQRRLKAELANLPNNGR